MLLTSTSISIVSSCGVFGTCLDLVCAAAARALQRASLCKLPASTCGCLQHAPMLLFDMLLLLLLPLLLLLLPVL
jgi:hypothetical protein